MKKFIVIIAIIIVCLVLLSRFNTSKPEDELVYDTSYLEGENITEEVEETYSFEYTDVHFNHSPNDNIKISITYPQFKDEKLSTLNTNIEEFAKSDFKNIINDENVDSLELSLTEKCMVKLANDELVSISLEGELTQDDAAHPNILKNSLNIHPRDYRNFKITELLNITDEFVNLFKEKSSSDEQLAAYLTSFSDEEIKEKIKNSKMYFDEEDVVIIFEVPHAIGDFIDIKFEKDVIQPYI